MRIILATVIAFFSVNALAVTVDFESDVITEFTPPPEWGAPASTLAVRSTQHGFSFGYDGSFEDWGGENLWPMTEADSHLTGLSGPCEGCGLDTKVWREDGQLFSVTSLDLIMGFNYYQGQEPPGGLTGAYSALNIRGYNEAGVLVATQSVNAPYSEPNVNVVFDSTWTNISYMTIGTQLFFPYYGLPSDHSPGLDNFTATVVPVPAAIWLFISGLSVLGLRRRFG